MREGPFPTLKRLILPGLVFQSVVIAGGYGTGRELVEFFLSQGPAGGLLAMGVSTLLWSLVCMATFELARVTGHFEYRGFMRTLMGPLSALYELAYISLLLLVLAVVGAAAGEIVRDTFGLPYALGVVVMLGSVGYLTIRGSSLIERFLTAWSLLLYLTYAVFAAWTLMKLGPIVADALGGTGDAVAAAAGGGAGGTRDPAGGTTTAASDPASALGWIRSGLAYAGYNLGVIPAVLFTLRNHRSRGETLAAGILAGPLAMIPALLFYIALLGGYPAVMDRAVPATAVLEALGSRPFTVAFQVVLLGTLVETGTGLIHAVNERLAHQARERGRTLSDRARGGVAVLLLGCGVALSSLGLVALIARGYGLMTWIFLLVFVLPVLTLGPVRILQASRP